MSISLYTKHRPAQISDIVGQENVVKAIKKQAINDTFSHAYLLCGQFGGGKTSVARIIAKLMTCPNKKGDVVCGKCKACLSINNGYCVDVYEIDAASKRGIDDARKIRDTANYAPQELKKKIYIFDETHMLTTEAWNALLKIVEEPPEFAAFIFCTTDHRKVPNTIMSRCQRFSFSQIPVNTIKNRLQAIAKIENIKIDEDMALAIAKLSKGSLRDAINYLEQLSVVKDNNISGNDVLEYLGIPEEKLSYEIVGLMIAQDAASLLAKVDDLLKAGIEAKTVLYEITDVLRNVFICKTCGKDSKLLNVLDGEKKTLNEFAEKIGINNLTKIAGALYRIEKDITLNINERWVLEAALINCLMFAKNDATQKK